MNEYLENDLRIVDEFEPLTLEEKRELDAFLREYRESPLCIIDDDELYIEDDDLFLL